MTPSRPICERCDAIIFGPAHVVEVSRLTHRGPELERVVDC